MNNRIDEYIDSLKGNFDPGQNLLKSAAYHGGYHSSLPLGAAVHPLRDSAQYGLALLKSSDRSHRKTGGIVLHRITSLQEQDSASPWYGNWPYFAEEPQAEMIPPDQNWRCFVGQYLFLALAAHPDELTEEQRRALETSLSHAAYGIFRRNMQPAYTNIAAFEASLLACLAARMDDPFIKDYAFSRFRQFAAYTERQGGFNEYNSPNYAVVVLKSLELAHRYGRDGRIDSLLDYLHRREWELLSEYYHPVLGEISGPHSRAYSDILEDPVREFLALRAGSPLPGLSARSSAPRGGTELDILPPWPCPEDLRRNFTCPVEDKIIENTYFRGEGRKWAAIPEDPFGCQKRHTAAPEGDWNISGYTAVRSGLSLGTVSRDSLWTQRRPYLGYAAAEGNDLAVFRIRVLKDGRDWASACLYNSQRDLSVLSAVTFLKDFGDHHLFLDRHRDSAIPMSDLRIRFQVENSNIPFRETDRKGVYALQAENYTYRILIPREMRFNGQECQAERNSRDRFSWIDIPLPLTGPELDLKELEETSLFFGTCVDTACSGVELPFPERRGRNEYGWKIPDEDLKIRTFGLPEYY